MRPVVLRPPRQRYGARLRFRFSRSVARRSSISFLLTVRIFLIACSNRTNESGGRGFSWGIFYPSTLAARLPWSMSNFLVSRSCVDRFPSVDPTTFTKRSASLSPRSLNRNAGSSRCDVFGSLVISGALDGGGDAGKRLSQAALFREKPYGCPGEAARRR